MPKLRELDLICRHKTRATIDVRRSPRLGRIIVWGDFEMMLWSKASKGDSSHLNKALEPELLSPPRLLQLALPSSLMFRHTCVEENPVRSCLNFLESVPLLEELQITFEGASSTGLNTARSEANRILLPKLRNLRLVGFYSELILESVTIPSLAAFKLNSSGEVRVSYGVVTTLLPAFDFFRNRVTEETMIEASHLLPKLRDFRLNYVATAARIFQELTVPDSGAGAGTINSSAQSALYPALEVFSIFPGINGPEGNQEIHVKAFIAMIESRVKI